MDWTRLKDNFSKRGYQVYVCENEEDVKKTLRDKVLPEDIDVAGFGNSQTCRDLNLIAFMRERAKEVYVHDPKNYSSETTHRTEDAEVYFASVNAISEDGHIVNIDGTGNRVAAMCYGPAHVILIVGRNKIVDTLEHAVERAKHAAVEVAVRGGKKTPCTVTGKCEECLAPDCVCSVMTIHRKVPKRSRISILFVQQDVGL